MLSSWVGMISIRSPRSNGMIKKAKFVMMVRTRLPAAVQTANTTPTEVNRSSWTYMGEVSETMKLSGKVIGKSQKLKHFKNRLDKALENIK